MNKYIFYNKRPKQNGSVSTVTSQIDWTSPAGPGRAPTNNSPLHRNRINNKVFAGISSFPDVSASVVYGMSSDQANVKRGGVEVEEESVET